MIRKQHVLATVQLEADPDTLKVVAGLGGLDGPRKPKMVPYYMIQHFEAAGYRIQLLDDGQEVVWKNSRSFGHSIKDCILMAKGSE